MKILFLLNNLPLSKPAYGKADKYPRFLEFQKQLGHEAYITVLNHGYNHEFKKEARKLGINIVPEHFSVKSIQYLLSLNYLIAWKKICVLKPVGSKIGAAVKIARRLPEVVDFIEQAGKPDLIFALQSTENTGIFARILNKKFDIPYIIWECRSQFQRQQLTGTRKKIVRDAIENSLMLLPDSTPLGESIKKELNINKSSMEILTEFVPDYFFNKPPQKPDFIKKIEKKEFIFAAWTNWRKLKRLDIIIEAFYKLKKNQPGLGLVVAGPISTQHKPDLVGKNDDESIIFTGSLPRTKIHQLAHYCDCCLLSSDYETFGLPLIEAMAAGKPSVATKCGGPESILTKSFLGKLVKTNNIEEFSDGMRKIIDDNYKPGLIKEYCKNNYSENSIRATLNKIYNRLKL